MTSNSTAGASSITLQFALSLPLDVAEQQVQAAINAASNLLPRDLPAPPIYNKVNPADAAVITLAITSPTVPLPQVRDLVDTRMAQKISQVTGVGLVTIAGGQKPAMRIQANPQALAAHGLALADIRAAVVSANVNQPKGTLDGPVRSTTIDANDQLRNPTDYRDLIVAYRNEAPLRLGDVAEVVMDAEDSRLAAWANQQPAILLNVQRQPGQPNALGLQSIKQRLIEMQSCRRCRYRTRRFRINGLVTLRIDLVRCMRDVRRQWQAAKLFNQC